ncbi:MAG: NB-ARC domain-containing protein, partial [Cyanobacteriota bacterium]
MEQLEAATRPVALIGQGGVGKTRLAIEHAWKQVVRRPVVLLVSADSPEALNRNLAGLCGPQALDLPEKGEREEAPQRAAVLQWLQAHPGWLLILDSVDTPGAAAAVEALLPQLAAGQVAITTRLSNWSAAVQGMAVDVLEPVDAREFLLERTVARRQKSDDDATTAGTIAVDEYPFMDWLSAFKCRMVVQEVPG